MESKIKSKNKFGGRKMKTKIFLLFLILQFLNLLILNNIYAKEDADYWFNEGGKAFEVGNYDKAIEYYTKVIEINPKDAKAYYNRGVAYAEKGLQDKAIKDYNKGEYGKAIKDFIKALYYFIRRFV